MQAVKCDVILRFDEANGRIAVYAMPSTQLEPLLQHPYRGWSGSVEQLRSLGFDAAEGLVGRHALRELDRHSQSRLGLRDYDALEREELQGTLAALELQAASGDPELQFEAFRVLWNQALKQRSTELLERAEQFLNAAASQGHEHALGLAAVWPKLRAEARESIGRTAV